MTDDEYSNQETKGDDFDDDRRRCIQCANLTTGGLCVGGVVANRHYLPVRDQPRRCEGYAPGPDDADRRHGRERWPGLFQTFPTP